MQNLKKNNVLIFLITNLIFSCHSKKIDINKNKDNLQNESQDDNSSEDLIIGGRLVTKKNELAATTISLIDTRLGSLCTASILSENIAITAAHCVEGNVEDMQISFGVNTASQETRSIDDIALNSIWKTRQNERTNNGDIALVKFSGGLPKKTHAATLIKKSYKLSNGEIVTLAGFGISKLNGLSDGSGRLRTVDVKIANANFSQTEVSIDQRSRKGACHGDSGGPAFIQDTNGGLLLWGITSRGIKDPTDQCAGESVYTRIMPYSRWINSVVKIWNKN